MEQKDYALSCMKEWLSHENELGKEPYQIEMAGSHGGQGPERF